MKCVVNSVLYLFHFNFRCGTDLNYGYAACEFGKSFVEFFFVVIGCCSFDLLFDALYPDLDIFFLAQSVNDLGVLFVNYNCFGTSEHFQFRVLELHSELFGDQLSACQGGDIFKHLFSSVAETGSFDSSYLQRASELVDHESCKCFALNIFSHDDQRLSGLSDFLQNRYHFLYGRDLFIVKQDVRIFHPDFHCFGIVYEIR